MKFFNFVTKVISGSTYPTLPTIIPAYNFLMDQLEDITRESNNSEIKAAAKAAYSKLQKYYARTSSATFYAVSISKYSELVHKDLTYWPKSKYSTGSRYEDEIPRTTSMGWLLDGNLFEANAAVFDQYKEFFPETQQEEDHADRSPEDVETSEPEDIGDLLLKHKYGWLDQGKTNQEKVDELQSYLDRDPVYVKNILSWWKEKESEFPVLEAIAKDYLAIPGTWLLTKCPIFLFYLTFITKIGSSVPVERLFSSAAIFCLTIVVPWSLRLFGHVCWKKSRIRHAYKTVAADIEE